MKGIKTAPASVLWFTVAALAAGQGWHQGKGRLEGSVTSVKGNRSRVQSSRCVSTARVPT